MGNGFLLGLIQKRQTAFAVFAGLSFVALNTVAQTSIERVQDVFKRNCYSCHDSAATGRGARLLSTIEDLQSLVDGNLVKPNDVAGSYLMERLLDLQAPMPPVTDYNGQPLPKLSPADLEAVKAWILDGAPSAGNSSNGFNRDDVERLIREDLNRASERGQQLADLRYLSFHELHNQGLSDAVLFERLNSMSGIVNSLSWEAQIKRPVLVGTPALIARIVLSDYGWSAATWEEIVSGYPFRAEISPGMLQIASRMETAIPWAKMEWFAFQVTQPKKYHQVLELPERVEALESFLGVNVLNNVFETLRGGTKTVRSGFNDSGVSKNNRVIERHGTRFGAYWKSYDFRSVGERKNIFENPLGPGVQEPDFKHDGGESIFNLPNRLQAYLLYAAEGDRLDIAPQDIVADPERPEGIINGFSCMSCHLEGIKQKNDQIRNLLSVIPSPFASAVLTGIDRLYPAANVFSEFVREDANLFLQAIKVSQYREGNNTLPLSPKIYERDIDAKVAGADFGLSAEEFKRQLRAAPSPVVRVFGNLLHGRINREVYENGFAQLSAVIRLGGGAGGNPQANEVSMQALFVVPTGAPQAEPQRRVREICELKSSELAVQGIQNSIVTCTFSPVGVEISATKIFTAKVTLRLANGRVARSQDLAEVSIVRDLLNPGFSVSRLLLDADANCEQAVLPENVVRGCFGEIVLAPVLGSLLLAISSKLLQIEKTN